MAADHFDGDAGRGSARGPDLVDGPGRGIDGNRMFSLSEIADLIGVSVSTVRRRIDEGALRVHRIGRVRRVSEQDLMAFLTACREGE